MFFEKYFIGSNHKWSRSYKKLMSYEEWLYLLIDIRYWTQRHFTRYRAGCIATDCTKSCFWFVVLLISQVLESCAVVDQLKESIYLLCLDVANW